MAVNAMRGSIVVSGIIDELNSVKNETPSVMRNYLFRKASEAGRPIGRPRCCQEIGV